MKLKPKYRQFWLCFGGVSLLLGLSWWLATEPRFRGRPESHWVIETARIDFPDAGSPRLPNERGLVQLSEMGPKRAARALVRASLKRDSLWHSSYRKIYARLPDWYRDIYPLRPPADQVQVMARKALQGLNPNDQKAIGQELLPYLSKDEKTVCAALMVLSASRSITKEQLNAIHALMKDHRLGVRQKAFTAKMLFDFEQTPDEVPLN